MGLHTRKIGYVCCLFGMEAIVPNGGGYQPSISRLEHRQAKVILCPSQVWVRRLGNSKNKRRFHFEEAWAMDNKSWGISQGQDLLKEVLDKLADCSFSIDDWGYKKYNKIKKRYRGYWKAT